MSEPIYTNQKQVRAAFWRDNPNADRKRITDYSGEGDTMKINKYLTVYVVQGAYGQGWEDVCAEETGKEARARLKEYRENETQYAHRLITRRELNPNYTAN